MKRQGTRELIDGPLADRLLLEESLGDLAQLNRFLGGTATIVHQLGRLLAGVALERLSVLDVGAGGGDILRSLGAWCERRGIGLGGVALDLGRTTSRLAAARLAEQPAGAAVRVVCADARALPFPDRRFDVAICSTFLHHLEPDDAVIALGEMARVSGLGLVVSDLRRSLAGWAVAWLLARTVWRGHRYTRHDAPVSMRAAYTAAEARALAERAGLTPVVEPQPWFRWALRWRRSA